METGYLICDIDGKLICRISSENIAQERAAQYYYKTGKMCYIYMTKLVGMVGEIK